MPWPGWRPMGFKTWEINKKIVEFVVNARTFSDTNEQKKWPKRKKYTQILPYSDSILATFPFWDNVEERGGGLSNLKPPPKSLLWLWQKVLQQNCWLVSVFFNTEGEGYWEFFFNRKGVWRGLLGLTDPSHLFLESQNEKAVLPQNITHKISLLGYSVIIKC